MDKEVNMLTSRKGGQRSMHTPPRSVPGVPCQVSFPRTYHLGLAQGLGSSPGINKTEKLLSKHNNLPHKHFSAFKILTWSFI